MALAGANLLRNVLEVYKKTGVLPVAINHDCLMYAADSEKAEIDFGKTCLGDGEKFTHEWTAPSDKFYALVNDGINASQLESRLKAEVLNHG